MAVPTSTSGYRMLILVVSVVVGLLGANPFADAIGFPAIEPRGYGEEMHITYRVMGGIIVFLLAATFLRFLVVQVRVAAIRIGQSPAKPDWKAALTALICGTLCVLGALWVQVYASTRPVSMTPSMTLNGSPGGMTINGNPVGMAPPSVGMSMNLQQAQGSVTLACISALTILVGTGLLAFGTWASLKPDRERVEATAAAQPAAAKPDGLVVGVGLTDSARI